NVFGRFLFLRRIESISLVSGFIVLPHLIVFESISPAHNPWLLMICFGCTVFAKKAMPDCCFGVFATSPCACCVDRVHSLNPLLIVGLPARKRILRVLPGHPYK